MSVWSHAHTMGNHHLALKSLYKKKLKKFFFSFYDKDPRTAKKAHTKLLKNKIQSNGMDTSPLQVFMVIKMENG